MEIHANRVANDLTDNIRITSIRPLIRIYSELQPHLKMVAANQIICLVTLGIGFLVPFALKYLTEELQLGHYNVLIWVPLISFFLLVVLSVTQMLRSIIAQYISIKISQSLQKRILNHYLGNDIIEYFKKPMGEKVSRMTFDIHWFVEGATIFLSETLYLPLVVIGCVGIMFSLDWRMAVVAIVVSPISLLANKPFSKRLRESSISLQEQNALLSRHILDTLKGMLLIKVFAREHQENEHFDGLLNNFVRLQVKNNFWGGLFRTTISLGNAFIICLVCWFAFFLLTKRQTLEISTFVAFSSVMFYFFGEIGKIGGIMNTLVRAAVSCDRIFQLLENRRKPEVIGNDPAVFSESLAFENVSFCYGDEKNVLENVNLQLKRGDRIALMGMSGAGKTTLINLMLGLLIPQQGRIVMDGKNLNEIERDSLRGLFGYSPQMNVLFFMTVAENIAYSRSDATRDDIIAAAKISCAHDFIMQLPQGYDTIVGEDGANLSEGQRQRIALARAVIRNTPIIILDESSAHVDLITERKIYQNIMSLPEKTVVLVSHRPSVLKEADSIYSIADGQVINVGSFDEFEVKMGHGDLLRAMEFIH
jgi:ABC-type multidrug transport system fused ATPase/permease subunit